MEGLPPVDHQKRQGEYQRPGCRELAEMMVPEGRRHQRHDGNGQQDTDERDGAPER